MKSVKVSKTNLLKSLLENARNHERNVIELRDERGNQIVSWMEVSLDNLAVRGIAPKMKHFPEVPDHSSDYQRAIKMVELSEDDVIELSASEFDQYVMDNWSFKHDLFSTSQFYGKALV